MGSASEYRRQEALGRRLKGLQARSSPPLRTWAVSAPAIGRDERRGIGFLYIREAILKGANVCRATELSGLALKPDITAAIAACVRDGRRMAETAKRAWFTTARPEALAKGDAPLISNTVSGQTDSILHF